MEKVFVLDHIDNPHPVMLAGALGARAHAGPYWYGYLAAMVAATGCTEADIEAWMDRHQ